MTEPAEASSAPEASEVSSSPEAPEASAVDPMKGFRGVMAGALVLEAIVVALGLLVISRLYGGLTTVLGLVAAAVVVGLVAGCWLLRYRWSVPFVLVLQLVLVCCVIGSVPVGVIGVLFSVIWVYLLWLRRDVARRMAQGRLPSQQR